MTSTSAPNARFVTLVCVLLAAMPVAAQVIDHNHTDIWQIPDAAIEHAKETLHIAYGHTSHGSQLISGMGTNGGQQLDAFMTANGATPGLYLWNNGGSGGALDLRDTPFSGAADLGNPDRYAWEAATRSYLAAHPDTNVIIWSWCGQAATSIANIDIYLNLMEGLILDYPEVTFVFMTGHLTGDGPTGQLNLANEHIRNHCIAYDRVLYDFADIESYDPDGLVNYMELDANDNCDYDSDGNGSLDANWALDWQASHVEGVDWWPSGAAHSQHLNGNLKGYAAWWLWATIAGWNQCVPAPTDLTAVPDPVAGEVELNWTDNSELPDEDSFIIQFRVDGGTWDNTYASVPTDITTFTDTGLEVGTYQYRVVAHLNDDGTGVPCDSPPTNVVTVEIVETEPPDPPSDLAAIADSHARSISLTWADNSNNESGFTLQRRVGSGAWNNAYDPSIPANATSYVDATLTPQTYTYRLVATNEWGTSAPSNEASATIVDLPLPPSGLEATGDSVAGTVSLAWVDQSDNELGFIVQRQVDGGAWNNAYDTVGVDVVTYLDDNHGGGRLPDATYTYRVVATNANGESLPSNEDWAVIASVTPAAPTDLESELVGFDVTLTWVDQSDNEESFILERQVDGGDYEVLATLPLNTESFVDSNLQPLHTYTYRVKARNSFGDSDYSNETSEYVAEQSITISLKQGVDGYEGCRDAYLESANPTYNYGGDPYNGVQNSPKTNMVISFDMPAELHDKVIVDATIGFYCWTVSSWQEDQYLDLYQVTEEWVEGDSDGSYEEGAVSWQVRAGEEDWTVPGGTHAPELLDSSLIPNEDYYPEFDITDLVQDWVDGTTENHGVLLVNDSPVGTGIKASEYSEYGRPYMEITYAPSAYMIFCDDFEGGSTSGWGETSPP